MALLSESDHASSQSPTPSQPARVREVWSHVNEKLDNKTISRSSIIIFLNALVDEGILEYEERTGKGGYYRVYKPKMVKVEFRKYLVKMVISSLMKNFPNETKEVLESLEH